MPAKNSIKIYAPNSYYHLYNRGVEKRNIFIDRQDYSVFLFYLKEYLSPKPIIELREKLNSPYITPFKKDKILKLINMNNFYNEIYLHSFSLLSNHFHLLIQQTSENSIDKFMNSLCTRYTMYLNRKLDRVGKLFQGVYKAVLVKTDEQLLQLSRYIHLNPLNKSKLRGINQNQIEKIFLSQPSSYLNYLGKVNQEWVITKTILSYFSKTNPNFSYKSFMEGNLVNFSFDGIGTLLIDENDN